MSELKEIAAIILKHLSDALLSAAHELQTSKNTDPIIASLKTKFVSLKVGVHVVFEALNGKRYGATVDKIDGDSIEVSNDIIGKSWTVKQSDIINISDGDFFYK